jgi:histone H3/H4
MRSTMTPEDQAWKRCSACKTPIDFGATFYRCSVSTCNRKRTGLFFCSVECFDSHVPGLRHRDAWAEQSDAPSREQWQREQAEERAEAEREAIAAEPAPEAPRRRIVGAESETELPHDSLVVVSKLKTYVRARSGMNTSDGVVSVLSDHLRRLCDEAIRVAARDGRKTVLDRDFREVLR